MENEAPLKFVHLHNESLRAYLKLNETQILNTCKNIVNKTIQLGEYLSNHILSLDMKCTQLQKEPELVHILNLFFDMNPQYYYNNFEIHVKDHLCMGTPIHSDRYTWMLSDKHLVNQAWILLYNNSPNNYKNINLYDNPTYGLHSHDSHITTLNGFETYNGKKILDGTSLNVGDILLFQNGIVHGTDSKTDVLGGNSHRIALAISFYKHEWVLTNNLTSYFYNLWSNDKTNINLSKKCLWQLSTHVYSVKLLKGNTLYNKNPEKVYKKQDYEWFEILKNELLALKF